MTRLYLDNSLKFTSTQLQNPQNTTHSLSAFNCSEQRNSTKGFSSFKRIQHTFYSLILSRLTRRYFPSIFNEFNRLSLWSSSAITAGSCFFLCFDIVLVVIEPIWSKATCEMGKNVNKKKTGKKKTYILSTLMMKIDINYRQKIIGVE